MRIRTTGTVAAVLALLAFTATEALAHGEATLRSAVKSVAAGAPITLNGEDFEPGESYQIILRGALQDYELGTAAAAADSTFTTEFVVPDDARPGQYRIVAMGPDGDEDATLDMVVTAAQAAGTAGEKPAGHAGEVAERAMGGARVDDIVVERNRSGVEWGLIGLLIGLAGGLGVGFLRKT